MSELNFGMSFEIQIELKDNRIEEIPQGLGILIVTEGGISVIGLVKWHL